MIESGTYKCSQNDCSIFTDGKCVNGQSDCPNKIKVIKGEVEEAKVFTSDSDKTSVSKFIQIPWGESFTSLNLSNLTFKYRSNLILLVGEPSCGKSTLYAALFDSFNKGKCGDYFYAGSKTPIGFESICHLAREKSNGRTPSTERTKSYDFTYLHLAVRKNDLTTPIEHLIFADVNGERFQDVRDSDEEARKLTILGLADQIYFVADGGLLIDSTERHAIKDNVWKTIGRCIQNNMIPNDKRCHLIITKWDEITSAGKTKDVTDFFITPTLEKFDNYLAGHMNIASRSLNDAIPPRYGLDVFLKNCTKPYARSKTEKNIPIITREYQRFKYEINE